jgi:hypothetical protein
MNSYQLLILPALFQARCPVSITLSIGNTVVLSWPANADAARLQATTSGIGETAQWSDVQLPVTTKGDRLEVIVQPTASASFYRLVR